MGEYAEYEMARERRYGRDPSTHDGRRNPVAALCLHCGKGIRPIAGRIEESMAQHMKSKGCVATHPTRARKE